jgi:hypothetical protein
MTAAYWVWCLFPIALAVLGSRSQNLNRRKLVGVMIFLYFLLNCTVSFDAVARDVAVLSQSNGRSSEGYVAGVIALNDASLKVRVLLGISAVCMLLLIVFPPVRRQESINEKS